MLYGAIGAAVLAVVAVLAYLFIPRTQPAPPDPVPQPQAPVAQTPKNEPPPGMVLIPAGTFEMGRASDDPAEGPPHQMSVESFFMDKTEVTNEQYAEFVKETGHKAPDDWKDGTYPPGKGDFPVVNVEWLDARAYAEWAGKRLPSEVEWEYAARGTDGRRYPWGSEPRPDAAFTKESGVKSAQPVGSAPAGVSPFGMLDMNGNVWEWCEDTFHVYPGSTYQAKAEELRFKIIRGGSFESEQKVTDAITRNWVDPAYIKPTIGFRCAKSLE
jgi:serine/threonine-protein kinase